MLEESQKRKKKNMIKNKENIQTIPKMQQEVSVENEECNEYGAKKNIYINPKEKKREENENIMK